MFHNTETVAGPSSPFQHLAARLNLTQAKKAEDDEDNKKKDAKAEDKGDDKDDKDDKDEKKSKKAKNEDDERGDEDEKMSAEEKEDDDGEEKEKKSKKKSKSAKADDGDQDEPHFKALAIALGRSLERKRISEILLSPEANASNACYLAAVRLALKSHMTADEVVAILELNSVSSQAAPKDNSRREALEQRMAKSPKPDIGVDGEGGPEPTFAQKVILAGKRRRGEI